MTNHTDAELLPCPFCGDHAETDFIPEHHSYAIECHSTGCAARVIKETAEDAVEAWNRRAPAAPVPQGWKLVPEWPTVEMSVAGDDVYREDGPDVFSSNTIYTRMLAAAPQPPEATVKQQLTVEAAPVQMPEPESRVHSKLGTTCMFPSSVMRKGDKIYTEQQVREILKAHGINVKKSEGE